MHLVYCNDINGVSYSKENYSGHSSATPWNSLNFKKQNQRRLHGCCVS